MYSSIDTKKSTTSTDAFADMFGYELNVEQHLTPAQRERIECEKLAQKFGTGRSWLSQPEQRADFRALSPVDQLRAAFGGCNGLQGSELEALIEHMNR